MSNVLTMWKQRSHEGQAPRLALDDKQNPSAEEKVNAIGSSSKGKPRIEAVTTKENTVNTSGISTSTPVQSSGPDSQEGLKPISSGGTIRGVIRGSGRGVLKSDTSYSGPSGITSTSLSASVGAVDSSSPASIDLSGTALPFRTDASALGSYTPPVAAGSSKRRFSEMPVQPDFSQKEQNQTTYRDRAAERRSLYGSSAFASNQYDLETGDSDRDPAFERGVTDSMPFPPGVGGRGVADGNYNVQSYEVITAEKAIDESNVGNRMLRNMGWKEGLGLGKDGSGMVEPVQAQSVEKRAGLGSQPKKLDPSLEVQAGDSYRTLIQKKALARFREMS